MMQPASIKPIFSKPTWSICSLGVASHRRTAGSSSRTRPSGSPPKQGRQCRTATAPPGATNRTSYATTASRARVEFWLTSVRNGGISPFSTPVPSQSSLSSIALAAAPLEATAPATSIIKWFFLNALLPCFLHYCSLCRFIWLTLMQVLKS